MTFVAINVLSVPAGAGDMIEQRFAGRAGMVESSPGFVRFELLRPLSGTSDYLVATHWESEQHFEDWKGSQAFGKGHAAAAAEGGAPAAPTATLWTYEVVQSA